MGSEKEKAGPVNRPQLVQFYAYETIGAAIPRVAPVYVYDDPAGMTTLHEAILSGRVVMDGDTIVSIDGVPIEQPSPEEQSHDSDHGDREATPSL